MRTVTPGRLLFEQIVPSQFTQEVGERPIGSEQVTKILQMVAEREPDKYREISHGLLKLGAKASIEVPASFGLEDLKSPIDKKALLAEVEVKEEMIRNRKDLTPKQRSLELVKLYSEYSSSMPEKVYQASSALGSNLAKMVASGARGNKGQLNSNIGADWLMLDANSNPIPVPIKNSYAEGLSPAEYYASAYGTRRGLLSTKFCCMKGQRVLMADFSEKEIQDIKPGDWVMGSDLSGKTFPVRVVRSFENGNKECWRFVFRYLSSRKETVDFCGTLDHQLLARKRDWGRQKHLAADFPTKIQAGRMTKTRHVLVPAECDGFGGEKEYRALLLGILLGDGCTSPSAGNNLKFSCGDELFLADIQQYLASLNFWASKGCDSENDFTYNLNYIVQPPKKDGGLVGWHKRSLCGCPTKKWLHEIGIMGKYAHEKEIPECVWKWDNDSVAAVLSGLFSSDGSIGRSVAKGGGCGITISLCLTAKKIVEQTKRLLQLRFGIYSSAVYRVPKEQKQFAKRDQWSIRISHRRSIDRFARFIHLVGIKRNELLALRSEIASSRNNEQHTFKFLHKESLGLQPTFDIEIDHPDHLFVLPNGIISSNSVQEAGYLSKQLSAASHDLIVSSKDCETNRGFPSSPDDNDNIGAVMARSAGGFPAGTIITSRVLKQLKDNKVSNLVVRSPLTCGAKNGICAICAGIKEKNRFPDVGDRVGLAASSSVGEPLSQGTLSEKHCLYEETLVRMADWSVKRIVDIKKGDFVLGADKSGATFPVRVSRVFYNGKKQCLVTRFRIGKTKDIRVLISTAEHEILAQTKHHLHPKDRLNKKRQSWGICKKTPVGVQTSYSFSARLVSSFDDKGLRTEPHALLLGLLIGDGCYTKGVEGGGINLACCDPALIEDISLYVEKLGFKLSQSGANYRVSQIKRRLGTSHSRGGRWDEHPLKALLKDLAMYGKYAPQKEIPKEVRQWDNQSVAALVAGIVATDGCICLSTDGRPGLRLAMTAKQVVEETKFLLESRFGIFGSPVVTIPPSRFAKAKLPIHRFDIWNQDAIKFFQKAISVPGVKGVKLLQDILNLKPLRQDLDSRRATRISQDKLGELMTCDIEVDHSDHLFVLANGLIVSNSGGVSSSSGKAVSAFKSIDALVQVPEVFPNGAAVSEMDGVVSKIEPAPQGGHFVYVDNKQHYVGRNAEVTVKRGDKVEAGDTLSSGIPNPYDIVNHKGIGQGRVYFVNALRQAMRGNNLSCDRRQLEVLGRSLVNHVKVTNPDGYGSYLPDDIVEYSSVENDTPENLTRAPASKAIGKFLARPTLHYSVGTRITPSVAKTLEDNDEKEIDFTDDSPGFEPEMQRVMDIPGFKNDWQAQLIGSNLKKKIVGNAHSGDAISDPQGPSFIPGLAKGVGFGDLNHIPKP